MASHRIHVPVVQHGGAGSVRICGVIVRLRPNMSIYKLADVRDTAALCESVTFVGRDHRRGEWPFPAFVGRDPSRVAANAVIRGRSCELGLALAAVADYEGLDLAANIVATGCLNDSSGCPVSASDGSHAVLPVRQLRAKVDEARRHAAHAGGRWLILVPPALPGAEVGQADERNADEVEDQGTGAEELQCANVEVVAVASLLEAARLACNRPTFASAPLWARRGHLERLRLERGGLVPILEACRRLHAATDERHPAGGVALVYRYQALIHAAHALTELALAGHRPRWRDPDDPAAPLELAARLRAEALALAKVNDGGGGRSDVPADFRAAGIHYDACRVHLNTDFEWGLARLDQALRVDGLSRDSHSEYRRVLGTRAQFRWRYGLRLAALGWESAAERHIRRALDDIETARELAPVAEHPGEVARVLCYRATAHMALWCLEPDESKRQLLAARIETDLFEVLGDQLAHGHEGPSGPAQYPGWALALLYSWWGLDSRWRQVAEHWRKCRSLTFLPWPGRPQDLEGQSVVQSLLSDGPRLYCDLEVASLLAEAAVRCDDSQLLGDARSTQPRPGHLVALGDLLMWTPTAIDERLFSFDVARSIRAWAAGRQELALPNVGRRGERLDSCLGRLVEGLRSALNAGDPAAAAPPRNTLLLWTGRLPRSRHGATPLD